MKSYVLNQEEHHRRQTLQEEYLEMLKLSAIIRRALSLVMLAPFQGEQSPLVSDPGTSAERAALDHLSKK